MAVKLPRPDHYPVVGGREETPFACIYVIGSASARKPVRIGCCIDLQHHFKELQRAQRDEIELKEAFWLPDLRLAKRLVSAARVVLLARKREPRDGWFDVTVASARDALVLAAISLHLPMLTNQQYRKLCLGPAKRRENMLNNYMRRLGMSTREV